MTTYTRDVRKTAIGLAGATGLVLLAMVSVTLATGATQEQHEHYAVPAEYARALLDHPGALRLLMGLDVAFLCLYTAFFAALAHVLRGRPLVTLALVALVGTAVLDIVEDHHILALLRLAELGRPLDDATLAFQQTLSSTKFSLSYLGLVLLGLAIPRATKLGVLFALFLTVGTLMTAVLDFALPPDAHGAIDGGRWVGFLLGFTIAAAWLRAQPDPETSVPTAA